MSRDDTRRDNLLLRLASYTPRVDRDPLEDFCTETLAWCLRSSRLHLRLFLERIGLRGLETVNDPECVTVATQVAWRPLVAHDTDADDEEEADENTKGGRFDLLIEHSDRAFVIVVESKRSARIEQDQIERYRAELGASARFRGIPGNRRFLVGLTNYQGEIKGLLDAKITWAANVIKLLQCRDGLDADTRLIFEQFEELLKEKGLGPMELGKVIGTGVPNAWRECRQFQIQLDGILKRIRGHEDLQQIMRSKQRPKPDGPDWYGLYAPGSFGFYFGFWFKGDPQNAKLYLVVERWMPDDRRYLVEHLPDNLYKAFTEASKVGDWAGNSHKLTEKGGTDFAFARAVDQELDGRPDLIVQWFIDTSKQVLDLERVKGKKLRPK